MSVSTPTGTVLVAGAGISGIKSAIELAETGYRVLLVDESPQLGGILAKLDYQFPTDHCGMCRMLPMVGREYGSEYCMRKSLYHENIEILSFTSIISVNGEPGNFSVELIKKARLIQNDLCNELGSCIDVCPVSIPDEFNHGLTTRKAVYKGVPHNIPQMLLIDKQTCTRCGACVEVCQTGAINLDAKDEKETRQVNAIILASGIKLYNTREFEDAKSYFVSQDVVSALAFERMLSGTGSYSENAIHRPSDNKVAKKIAWIQCMGSRNKRQGRDYCSSICCMFALKEAVLAKEKGGNDTETTIFYMDMRTFGKGFHRYREKAVHTHGVRLVRCRVQEVVKMPEGNLQIRYFDPDTKEFFIENYDMVVLSTGQIPYENHKQWADMLSADLNTNRLLATEPYSRIRLLNKPGIFICGSLMGLTDISEAMSSGTAAAGEATNFLVSQNIMPQSPLLIENNSTQHTELPKVMVLLCRCQSISEEVQELDFGLLKSQLNQHHGVEEVLVVNSLCKKEYQQDVLDSFEKSSCNRLIIGACQPYMYRKTLKNLAQQGGFHSSLIQIFDLLSLSRKRTKEPEHTATAFAEIKSEIESMKLREPLEAESLPIHQQALIIGGGMCGMQSALSLAAKGVMVHLVEQSPTLGGYAGNHIVSTIDGLTPIATAQQMIAEIENHPKIEVHLNTQVEDSTGQFGTFETKLVTGSEKSPTYIHHGAVIIATGGHEGKTKAYEYGHNDSIITQSQLKETLEQNSVSFDSVQDVVMIQCVDSREKGKKNYCSRICCMWAVANSIALKEKNPDMRVFVLYRDMMTYGFNEQLYTKARQAGVIFVTFSLENKPEVTLVDNKPQVRFTETVLDEPIHISPDLLVLSTGVEPPETNSRLCDIFDLELTEDAFFKEADIKWRPVETKQLGIFIAGVAHSPMPLKDTLMQAEATAMKTFTYLHKQQLETARVVSNVRDALCSRCKRCIAACPYGARTFDEIEYKIVVNPAACQGCGMCTVACRNNAAEIPGWNDKQIMAVVDQKILDELSFTSA